MTVSESEYRIESKGGAARGARLAVPVLALGLCAVAAALAWNSLDNGTPGAVAGELGGIGLDQVEPAEMAGALTTILGSNKFRAQFQPESKSCPTPLAWVTVYHRADGSDGALRVQSGEYLSPTFQVTTQPQRIAIPYPAPYATGHGAITLHGAIDGLIVSLSPAWSISHLTSANTHPVTWVVRNSCAS